MKSNTSSIFLPFSSHLKVQQLPKEFNSFLPRKLDNHIGTHTRTHTYIHMYIDVCMHEDICDNINLSLPFSVITFYNENEALLAISNNSEEFHIAIVEVLTFNFSYFKIFFHYNEELKCRVFIPYVSICLKHNSIVAGEYG